jgi:lipopolysaccharide/colanic/teichoic acid biosynthesis glycosyltransferase
VSGFAWTFKRVEDVVVSVLVLLVTLPLMLVAAVLVLLTMGRPVLFRQTRPGLHGELFTVVKFRTMGAARDAAGRPVPDEDRVTPVGRFLRRTSLDELPQLWNVLKGDMSLVGPRPLLVQYLDRYTPEQARRHHVKPGITGLAQTNGRATLEWDDSFALDCWYVDNWSLRLDHRILARTARLVFSRASARQADIIRSEYRGPSS